MLSDGDERAMHRKVSVFPSAGIDCGKDQRPWQLLIQMLPTLLY